MPQQPPRVLLIDDDRNFRRVTALALREDGYEVFDAANGREGLERLSKQTVDVTLCDLNMPVMDGMEFLQSHGERGVESPVIVVTAYGSIESAVEAMRSGAFDYVTKPVNRGALRVAIDRAVEYGQLREENRRLRERLAGGREVERLLGSSEAMRALRKMLTRLAETNVPVLIRGESGVGKELAARALHYDGPRNDRGKFVVLNCAAVPAELLESLLFGHRKGAFTGAQADHEGKFEAADGGTLFLDEIGDMPLPLQAKLLRVLQEGEIERIGENATRKVDTRVVAATNQDLEVRIEDGAFRQDLYFRLAVVPVEIPPLRRRIEDLPILVRHFLGRHGSADVEVPTATLDALRQRKWPGNVRELENLVMRACALNPDLDSLETDHLQPEPLFTTGGSTLLSGHFEIPDEGVDFEEIEGGLLAAAWEKSGHNQSRGAKLLGMQRQAFIYRLQKHGIIAEYGQRDSDES
ncbi:MAG: sigma-54-dependent transcriptional regulator [Thermoanaerobaculales bacterium]